jgi:hypothetical protein
LKHAKGEKEKEEAIVESSLRVHINVHELA